MTACRRRSGRRGWTSRQGIGWSRRFGVQEWPALLRKLDRIDPSYQD